MRLGDQVTDSKGRAWTIQALLGRGLWGRTYLIETDNGSRAVLKCALGKADFKDRAVELADACQQAAHEQCRLLSGGSQPYLPALFDTIELDTGQTALIMPHLGKSLANYLDAQIDLATIFKAVSTVAAQLTEASPILHGNLSPTNIFLNDEGQVFLTDVMTVGLHEARQELEKAQENRIRLTPPEATNTPNAEWDPWALCVVMYAATATAKDSRKTLYENAHLGLDKVAIAALKDRILTRLKSEEANPRFLGRVSDQLSKLLNRGLSKEATPSPPYRFPSIDTLYPRARAISELINPHVENVGQVLLSTVARDGVFKDGAAPSFSVTVGCSSGTTHEDVATGIRVKDLDATGDSRVAIPGAQYTVKAHPSGRLRFDFTLPALPPGRFQVKVAFTVKESGDSPVLSEGKFEVRPPPGYVPPREEDPSARAALQFPTSKAPSSRPMAPDPTMDPPSDASDAAIFPEPIAPSSPGTDSGHIEREPIPTPIPTAPPTMSSPFPHTDAFAEPVTQTSPEFPTESTISPPIDVSANPLLDNWESLPDPIAPGVPEAQPVDAQNHNTQELPTWNTNATGSGAKNPVMEPLNRLVGLVWQNTFVAFIVILGFVSLFLLLVGFAMNACAS